MAVGRAGILPAVAGEKTGKMPVAPTGWKPVPQPDAAKNNIGPAGFEPATS